MEWVEGWSVREVMGGGSEDDEEEEEEESEDGELVDGEEEEVVKKGWDGLDLSECTSAYSKRKLAEFCVERSIKTGGKEQGEGSTSLSSS